MKLEYPFLQLPLKFDAERLLKEVEAIDESCWQPHPQGYVGNDALTLITPHGISNSDELSGPMGVTEYLRSCPYLTEVLQTIGGVWGRTRLMRLSGHAEVNAHVDVHYYWRERMRVHVPIITQPDVRFYCGDQDVHMAAGECWIFDTWRQHRVINDAARSRIHLVADTVGGEQFWNWFRGGKPAYMDIPGWAAKDVWRSKEAMATLRLESVNVPNVMSPWELREHLTFLFNEAIPNPGLNEISRLTFDLCTSWHALWIEFGNDVAAYSKYRKLRDDYLVSIVPFSDLKLQNTYSFVQAIAQSVMSYCVKDEKRKNFQEIRITGNEAADNSRSNLDVVITGKKPAMGKLISQPLILLSSPRSGSTMFFEALEKCPDLYSIGGESHELIESNPELHPSSKSYDSNVLGAQDCSSQIAEKLSKDFYLNARKGNGQKPEPSEVIRLLEKTPKNALRIPFMKALFPDAFFIYLYRDPKQVISSMIDAWQSGRFRTYPTLPGWSGKPWSLLLVPEWRSLIGKPLHHIVAHQWNTATRIMLDDLAQVDPANIQKVRYETLVMQPQREIDRICRAVNISPGNDYSILPLSRYTLSPPRTDKWQANAQLIAEVWPIVEEQAARARNFMSDIT